MTRTELIQTLKHYQTWRMGTDEELPMPEPKKVTEALNVAISEMENKYKSLKKQFNRY